MVLRLPYNRRAQQTISLRSSFPRRGSQRKNEQKEVQDGIGPPPHEL